MKKFSGVLAFFRNKYILAVLFFMIWMLFFDPKDWGTIADRRNKLHELQKSEKHLNSLISESNKELKMLKTSAQTIEKYAREKYYMKKDNEDLFIVNSR